MESTVNERINTIIEKSGLTLTAFARKIGIAQTSLRDCVKNDAEPKYSTLNKIIIAEPSFSAKWLLTGIGDMFENVDVNKEDSDEAVSLKNKIMILEDKLKDKDEMIDKLLNRLSPSENVKDEHLSERSA